MRSFFKKYHNLLLASLYAVFALIYFIIGRIPFDYNIIHIPLDDIIEFTPAFVLPYIIWFPYVILPLIIFSFKNEKVLKTLCATIYCEFIICELIFIIYPTCVDFRPSADGGGIFNMICRLIFACDNPVNVCPSLHCSEAVGVHLSIFVGTEYSKKYPLRIISAILVILICLSTMFIKQHSIVDAVLGVLLAVIIFAAVKTIFKKVEKNDNKAI